mmetsp:Transcript_157468/g.277799  ORF Transcript_157468/g.277799 Transcript_157468/m.277799 type:complete len:235 (+) Transcript_157468:407-1111(+)
MPLSPNALQPVHPQPVRLCLPLAPGNGNKFSNAHSCNVVSLRMRFLLSTPPFSSIVKNRAWSAKVLTRPPVLLPRMPFPESTLHWLPSNQLLSLGLSPSMRQSACLPLGSTLGHFPNLLAILSARSLLPYNAARRDAFCWGTKKLVSFIPNGSKISFFRNASKDMPDTISIMRARISWPMAYFKVLPGWKRNGNCASFSTYLSNDAISPLSIAPSNGSYILVWGSVALLAKSDA